MRCSAGVRPLDRSPPPVITGGVSAPDQAKERSYGEYRDALAGHRLPAAYCDLDLFEANAAALVERAAGQTIRPASKSVRVRALLQRVLERPGYAGLMCFSPGEAAWLAERGFDDLLVAYPSVSAPEIADVCGHVGRGKTIRLMVDSVEHVARLDRLATEAGVVLPLCLDLDMSSAYPGLWFGVRRSPLRDEASALAVARAIRASDHLRLEGLMGYEAQIAGLPDAAPGLAQRPTNAVVRALKRRSAGEVIARRVAVVEALRAEGFELPLVNGGGTGSLERTATDPSVTEVTAGSGLFSPGLFDGYVGFRHAPAAGFAVPVVRRPTPGIVTCHGGGYVASGAAGKDKLPRPYLPRGVELLDQEGAGEVQTPVRYAGPIQLELGDPVLFRHAKAGELCERFNTILLISGGKVVDEVPTYRGEGQAFL